jgi:hypothetical protein
VRAGELVDHVALGDVDLGNLDGEAQLLWNEGDGDLAVADLADERMVVAVAALRRVASASRKPSSPRARFCSRSGRDAGRVSGSRVRSSGLSASDLPDDAGGASSSPSRSRMSPTRGTLGGPSIGADGARGRSPFAASEKSSRRWV